MLKKYFFYRKISKINLKMCDCHKKIGVLQIKTAKITQNLNVIVKIKIE